MFKRFLKLFKDCAQAFFGAPDPVETLLQDLDAAIRRSEKILAERHNHLDRPRQLM